MMVKKMLLKVFVLLVFLGLSSFYTMSVHASNSKVTITTVKSTASVNVSISDSSLEGKEISVICYSPQWNGSYSNWSNNEKYVVYLNQYKASATTKFDFKVKSQPIEGDYSLVISSANGRIVEKFTFFPPNPNDGGDIKVVKLSSPKSLKAVQSGASQVKVTWAKVTGAKSYAIYRSTKASSGFVKIGTTTATAYQDKKASAGKTFYYKVVATAAIVTANSDQSSAVKVLVLSAPSIKVKSTAKRTAVVTWKKVTGASGYKVFVATKKLGKYKEKLTLNKISKTKGTIKKLKSRKTCYIKVRAYTNVGGKKVQGKFSKIKKVKIR